MLGSANAVTAVSNGVRDSVVAAVPEVNADDVRVIPNAVKAPCSRGRPGHQTVTSSPPAGRLQDQKGFDLAIQALGRLTRRPPTALHLAGTGEEEQALRPQARRLGVAVRPVPWHPPA